MRARQGHAPAEGSGEGCSSLWWFVGSGGTAPILSLWACVSPNLPLL